jgi:hypothetical protein
MAAFPHIAEFEAVTGSFFCLQDYSMQISNIELMNDDLRIQAQLDFEAEQHRIYYQSDSLSLCDNLEAFISLSLIASMIHRETIQAHGVASQRFLNNLEAVQDFFLLWKPHYQRVEIQGVKPVVKSASKENRIGVFFSAGLDSFYTFLKHKDEITDLIFIHGFDIPLNKHKLRQQASQAIHRVAETYAKGVVEIETNANQFNARYVSGHQGYGAFLVSVGHLLFPHFSRIYIATGHTFNTLDIMEGSHPDLDPLWGNEGLEFVHDGLEATRMDKAAAVAQSDVALQTLRVCVENRGGAYNCGVCPKCLRTLINLRMAGAAERCTSFDRALDLKRVARIRPHGNKRVFLEEILAKLEESHTDPELEKAVRKALAEPKLMGKVIQAIEKLRFRGARRHRFQQ